MATFEVDGKLSSVPTISRGSAVSCPANSSGTSVALGCTCNDGYSGTIVATTTAPFFSGSCSPFASAATSLELKIGIVASAGDGFSGDSDPASLQTFPTPSDFSALYELHNKEMSKDVTLVITSCNRPTLLELTLQSFVKFNTYPIARTIVIDDSGVIGCNEGVLAAFREQLSIESIYNERNVGQVESIDRAYAMVTTPWIFHCEEDWEFTQPHFIEKSMRVFAQEPAAKIFTVWLRAHYDSPHPIVVDTKGRGFYEVSRAFQMMWDNKLYTWSGVTFNPGLRRTSVCMEHHPYATRCFEDRERGGQVGEYAVNTAYAREGYYGVILDDPSGHVRHIGWTQHVTRPWEG